VTRAALALVCALPLCGCASLWGLPPRIPECPGELVSTQAIAGDFVARERLRVSRGEQTVQLDLIVQKRGDELVLVGFDPLGAKLFTVVQSGTAAEVEAMPRAVVAVPPLNALRDVHRARFAAATDAQVETHGDETRIDNARCGTRSVLTRVSERSLP
jgi:hypothetical protein